MIDFSLISVIVPIYNVEKFLGKCLNCISNQSYKNLEIILVNDGSSDRSGKICEAYATVEPRVRLIYKANGGAAAARNLGLSVANGEFVYFADSDDYLELDAMQTLVQRMRHQDELDCIIFEASNFIDEACILPKASDLVFHSDYPICDGGTLITMLIHNKDYHASPYLFFFSAGLVSDSRFEEGIMFEDELFSYQLLLKCKKVKCLRKRLYHRRIHHGSVMTSSDRGIFRFHSISRVFRRVIDLHKKLKKTVTYEYLVRIGVLWFVRHDELDYADANAVKEEYNELLHELEDAHYWGSLSLQARRLGYAFWFILTLPRKLLRRIRLVSHH